MEILRKNDYIDKSTSAFPTSALSLERIIQIIYILHLWQPFPLKEQKEEKNIKKEQNNLILHTLVLYLMSLNTCSNMHFAPLSESVITSKESVTDGWRQSELKVPSSTLLLCNNLSISLFRISNSSHITQFLSDIPEGRGKVS